MSQLIEFLENPYTQAVFWAMCIIFAIYFANFVKKISFGEDTGTRAWIIIASALFIIGFRVSFKVIFPSYSTSYKLQITRFSLGIIGITLLFFGIILYRSTLRRMYGVSE